MLKMAVATSPFEIVLISDTQNPNNFSTDFGADAVALDSKVDWQIGASSLSYYYSWSNISAANGNNIMAYTSTTGDTGSQGTYTITFPDGNYEPTDIQSYIQLVLTDNGNTTGDGVYGIIILPNFVLGVEQMTILPGYSVDFSGSNLGTLLGFGSGTYGPGFYIAPVQPGFSAGIDDIVIKLSCCADSFYNGKRIGLLINDYPHSDDLPYNKITRTYPVIRWRPMFIGDGKINRIVAEVSNQSGVPINFGGSQNPITINCYVQPINFTATPSIRNGP